MEKPKRVGFKDLPKHTKSPFIEKLLLELEPRSKREYANEVAHTEGGEFGIIKVPIGDKKYFWHDPKPFMKIMNADNYKALSKFSRPASALFYFICSRLKPNEDIVHFTISEYFDYSGTSNRPQYYGAIVELCTKEFIAKLGSDSYYINPTLFFNGKRESLLETFVLAQDEYTKRVRQKLAK